MHGILKRKIRKKKKKNQKQKDKKCFKNDCKHVFQGDVGVIGCTLKVIVPIKQL